MAKFKIVKGTFADALGIYKAETKDDIIESDSDLSKRDGIIKFTEVEKEVVNIAPEVENTLANVKYKDGNNKVYKKKKRKSNKAK